MLWCSLPICLCSATGAAECRRGETSAWARARCGGRLELPVRSQPSQQFALRVRLGTAQPQRPEGPRKTRKEQAKAEVEHEAIGHAHGPASSPRKKTRVSTTSFSWSS
eukprot:scaffold641_cov237-Pinguiococcus_pyrenoidosus.AAC.5